MTTEGRRLRCAYLNVNGIQAKGDAISKLFDEKNIDILILAETWLRVGITAPVRGAVVDVRVEDEEIERTGGRRGREGMMILIKPEIQPLVEIIFVSETKRWAVLKVGDWTLVPGYFPPACPKEEIEDMLEHVIQERACDPDKLLVCGELNARTTTFGDTINNPRGRWLLRTIGELGLVALKPTEGRWTTVNNRGRGCPDILLGGPNVHNAVESYRVLEEETVGGSDHRPLIWDIVLDETVRRERSYQRWNVRKLDRADVRDKYDQRLRQTYNQCDGTIKLICKEITDKVTTQQQRQAAIDRINATFVDWINDAAEKAIKHVKFKIFQTAEKMATKENRPIFLKMVACMRARENKEGCKLDPKKMSEHCKHFESTFGAEPRGTVNFDLSDIPDQASRTMRAKQVNPTSEDLQTVSRIMRNYKRGKTPGPDNIFAEMLQVVGELTTPQLCRIMMLCEEWTVVPTSWRQANVALIYKKKGDATKAANYRPISLTCVSRRIYERFLMNRQKQRIEELLEPAQGGFRDARCTLHQVYALHEIMKAHPAAHHAFLDIKAAYDSVDRRLLWKDMVDLGFEPQLIMNLRALFDDNRCELMVHNHKSPGIRCTRGLLQGSAISPTLFTCMSTRYSYDSKPIQH